ncbi:serine threonine- phosphatase 2B catalytic subunit alpha isoform isoform X2 [Brachionus plicatilis]|uniref:Serine/threonine-protein phosphatase n=1 Tax=Brachionus plicatilis TaxID=10195 RepID=A0A3M7SZH6_BRAPC|nr:serine threonine- phosphatase 2B catalytic subunit alpha isoform isoform X2 [Brachionus plicatilis]
MGVKVSKNKKFTHQRIIKYVPPPIRSVLQISDVFDNLLDPDIPNLVKLKTHLEGEGRMGHDLVIKIISMIDKILLKEPNVLKIESPVTIVGDVHGQFYDLLTILSLGGHPDQSNYLFMGDFVDRGVFSFECVCYLYAIKVRYPHKIYLLRGNHESRHLTKFFTFRDECLLKANEEIYQKFMNSFDYLPIAAVVDSKFFCVHGGLSPSFSLVSELEKEDRFKEIPKYGVLCDLTWSDPIDNSELIDKEEKSSLESVSGLENFFLHNSIRGCSFFYTKNAIERFLKENNLISVIRAHQVQREGISLSSCFLVDPVTSQSIGFPSLINIFSAPNYCDVYKNKGAIIKYSDDKFSIKMFNAAEHPFVLPNFQNAFTWSLPFIFEKFSDLVLAIFNQISDEEADDKEFFFNSTENKRIRFPILAKLKKLSECRENVKKSTNLNRSELRLGSLTPNKMLRRKSSDAERELLSDLENKGVQSFEDADNLESLQYKIVNSDDEIKENI